MTYRRKLVKCGDVLDVEIYPAPVLAARGKKTNKSRAAQKALNDKRRLKNLVRMANTNFTESDYFATYTFDNASLPVSVEEAKRIFKNYIARLSRRATSEFKWLMVAETNGRLHFHALIAGVSADTIMEQWHYGIVTASKLRKVDGTFTALARYHGKHGKRTSSASENLGGCKSWTGSRNLKKPEVTVSDTAVTARQVAELITQFDEDKLLHLLKKSIREDYAAAEYEGGKIEDCNDWQYLERNYQINDISGYYLYATFVRRTV